MLPSHSQKIVWILVGFKAMLYLTVIEAKGYCSKMGGLKEIAKFYTEVETDVEIDIKAAMLHALETAKSLEAAKIRMEAALRETKGLVTQKVDPKLNTLTWEKHHYMLNTTYKRSVEACVADEGAMVHVDHYEDWNQLEEIAKGMKMKEFPLETTYEYDNVFAMSPSGQFYLQLLQNMENGDPTSFKKEDTRFPLVYDYKARVLHGARSSGVIEDLSGKKSKNLTVLCSREMHFLHRKGEHRDATAQAYSRVIDLLTFLRNHLRGVVRIISANKAAPVNATEELVRTGPSYQLHKFLPIPDDLMLWIQRLGSKSFHQAPNRNLYLELYLIEIGLRKLHSQIQEPGWIVVHGEEINLANVTGLNDQDLIVPPLVIFRVKKTSAELETGVFTTTIRWKMPNHVFKIQSFLNGDHKVMTEKYLWVMFRKGLSFTTRESPQLGGCKRDGNDLICGDQLVTGWRNYDCGKALMYNDISIHCKMEKMGDSPIVYEDVPCAATTDGKRFKDADILVTKEKINVILACKGIKEKKLTFQPGNWPLPETRLRRCNLKLKDSLILQGRKSSTTLTFPTTATAPSGLIAEAKRWIDTPFGRITPLAAIFIIIGIILVGLAGLLALGFAIWLKFTDKIKRLFCCCLTPGGCQRWINQLQCVRLDSESREEHKHDEPRVSHEDQENGEHLEGVIYMPTRDGPVIQELGPEEEEGRSVRFQGEGQLAIAHQGPHGGRLVPMMYELRD